MVCAADISLEETQQVVYRMLYISKILILEKNFVILLADQQMPCLLLKVGRPLRLAGHFTPVEAPC
jgi:hypothetical protein